MILLVFQSFTFNSLLVIPCSDGYFYLRLRKVGEGVWGSES